jgi:AcrR family transcriptional regulator
MERRYHHGALREALLAEGRRLLVEDGVDALTLRELARRTGVSHAAPGRHFPDRDALLDGLRAEGFDELTATLTAATRAEDPRARLRAYADGFVGFVVRNGPLASLMFSNKATASTSAGDEAAARFFAQGARLVEEAPAESRATLPYLIAGTFEGLAALVSAGRLPADRIDEVLDAAVEMLLPRYAGG